MRQFSAHMDALLGTALFAGIGSARLQTLLEDTPMEASAYQRGEVVFRYASKPSSLGVVLSGSALVYKLCSENKRILMSRLSSGSVFGMATLFGSAKAYPTEICAEQPLSVLFFAKKWLEEAFAREPLLARNYIALLSDRIQFLTQRIDVLAGEDIRARLLRLLFDLAAGLPAGEPVALPYSLSQLAQLLGVGRASLYRVLDTLENEGVIRRDGKTFAVLGSAEQDL